MENEILKLRKQGMTYEEIKHALNVSKNIVSFFCRKNGLSYPINTQKVSDEEIKKMQEFYNEHKSLRKTAKKFNRDKATVIKYIKTEKREKMSDDDFKKSKSKNVVSWRQRTKLKLVEHKGGKCKECGYSKCVQALEFHHLDPKEKDFTVSGKSWSFEKLKREVDKCVLVCNRCHTEIHAGLHENYK